MTFYPDAQVVRAVGLTEREVRALVLLVDIARQRGHAYGQEAAALPYAEAAMQKIAAMWLPR